MDPVILYVTSTCVYSRMAREFFARHGIPFEERDVTADAAAWAEMAEKSHQRGVPVIDVGGEIFVGFNRPDLEKALGIK